ncbi:MAG: DUF969 domain-containing protein [Phenylobacterium sp.]|uniref:DUF969 domain-containing protein n=1 Tax=Phenylobacterium sp. TaxID=1871053 RepID=UPI001B700748|nr:DUF969 domain-containing protein [Phenylobacterium sp.]MBP7648493.1 DUF969 domain-containing protein [Phenylobacterium sp.]MBP7817023.1 DUF969 domain-containing protein [Phenylobacterium sp.]MBP9230449.1 DUF969 domain-containing protein [Phenylobacterium sp.]MBP9753499.1 DUF969 domain-containing protein [Phenylobacterium sp.]
MLILLGVAVVVAGFAAGFNPLLVVMVSAVLTGMAAGLSPLEVLAAFGKAFNENRYVSAALLVLPVIGVLERAGLQERARTLIGGFRRVTLGRLLIGYLLFRQLTAALGLTSIAGHAQTIRPIVAPMAEAAAEGEGEAGELPDESRQRVRAMAAATDNIGLFFGEDIFMAIGSILLMVGFLAQSGIVIEPLQLSVWAIPTAVVAFAIHAVRLALFERGLKGPGA